MNMFDMYKMFRKKGIQVDNFVLKNIAQQSCKVVILKM